ncbi:MAG: CDP-glycerol glycerophosphotransferase family protein, partial [Eubacterium sp.]|nr:CDP-glycerol glycerophosphotransferase family protein [Eubacterium sp.]
NIQDEEEYNSIHLHVTSSFFKTEVAKTIQFEENMILGEDALFLNRLILKAGKFGAIANTQHNYRKRLQKTSAIQTKEINIRFYGETIDKFYKRLIKESKEIYGEVIPYIQTLLIYDIGWRVGSPKPDILSQEQFDEYCNDLAYVLSYVDDERILTNRFHRSFFKKSAMLRLKYNKDITSKFTYNAKNKFMYLCDATITKIPKNPDHCEIYSIEHKNGELIVEGLIKTWIIDADCTTDFVLSFAGKEYPTELKIFPHSYENTMFGKKYTNYQFISRIPFDEAFKEKSTRWIYPRLYFGDTKTNMAMHCGGRKMFSTIQCPVAYNILDEFYYIPTEKGIKFVKPNNIRKAEKKLNKSFNKWVYKSNKKAAFIRFLYQLIKPFKKRPLWIISDRMDIANDNGETFFRYLCEKRPENIDYEFVISKDSPDAEKIKSIGKTVYSNTLKYKLHFLLADKIISSQANEENLNAFAVGEYKYYYNLFKFDFVFLQHGIIKDDLSSWLNKRNKKIDLFITSAKSEQQSIINGDYDLDESAVKLTGLSRFDRLYNLKGNKKKQIIIMPTWRRSINLATVKLDEEQGKMLFLQSEYCRFYNKLINDERLLKVMKDNGCSGKFCLHPLHYDKTDCFFENEIFKVANGSINYQELFTQSALMITDYSSTFFDFCYLNK